MAKAPKAPASSAISLRLHPLARITPSAKVSIVVPDPGSSRLAARL